MLGVIECYPLDIELLEYVDINGKVIGKMPERKTDLALGYDLFSGEDAFLSTYDKDKQVAWIRSGIKIALPPGYGAKVTLRSGFGSKNRVLFMGSGWVDPDFRGEWKFPLLNLSDDMIHIKLHERICQFRLVEKININLKQVDKVEELGLRDSEGFGTTGKF